MILTARGAEQHSNGTDTAQAFINLALALGLPGKPGSGYGTITGQGNGQGGREHGQKADQLPGYRKLADPAAPRARRGGLGDRPGRAAAAGAVRVRDARPAGHRRRRAGPAAAGLQHRGLRAGRRTGSADRLDALDLLVVSDIFLSETAELADVVLPDRPVGRGGGHDDQPRGPGDPPPPGAAAARRRRSTTCRCCKLLADRLGRGAVLLRRPAARSSTSCAGPAPAASPTTPGITYERIDAEQGVFWPCPTEDHPGTPRLFADALPDPRRPGPLPPGRLHRDPAETPDADYPYVLTTGRLMAQYQSGTQTRRVPAPPSRVAEPEAQLHPDLARRLGDRRRRHRRAHAPAGAPPPSGPSVTDDIRPDTVFVPFHWGGASAANALTNPALDPLLPDAGVQGLRRRPCAGSAHPTTTTCSPAAQHTTALPPTARPTLEPAPPARLDGRTSPCSLRTASCKASTPSTGAGLDKPAPLDAELSLRRAGRRRSPRRCTSAAATPPTSWSPSC